MGLGGSFGYSFNNNKHVFYAFLFDIRNYSPEVSNIYLS